MYYIERDEFVIEPDEKGDQKIDIDGILQGGELDVPFCLPGSLILIVTGRRFKCSTFVLPSRHPTCLYANIDFLVVIQHANKSTEHKSSYTPNLTQTDHIFDVGSDTSQL